MDYYGSHSAQPEESIYHWIKVDPVKPEKPPRYRSKFNPKEDVPASTIKVPKKGHGTFGKKTEVNPKKFLRAREKTNVPTQAEREFRIGTFP